VRKCQISTLDVGAWILKWFIPVALLMIMYHVIVQSHNTIRRQV